MMLKRSRNALITHQAVPPGLVIKHRQPHSSNRLRLKYFINLNID